MIVLVILISFPNCPPLQIFATTSFDEYVHYSTIPVGIRSFISVTNLQRNLQILPINPRISGIIAVPPRDMALQSVVYNTLIGKYPPTWPLNPGISGVIAVPPPNMALHSIVYSTLIRKYPPPPTTWPLNPGISGIIAVAPPNLASKSCNPVISVLYIHKKFPVDPWPQNFEIVWLSGNTFLHHKHLVQVTNQSLHFWIFIEWVSWRITTLTVIRLARRGVFIIIWCFLGG